MRHLLKMTVFRRTFASTMAVGGMLIFLSLFTTAFLYEEKVLLESELRHNAVSHRMAREMGLFFDQASFQLQIFAGAFNTMAPSADNLRTALNDMALNAPHFMEISIGNKQGREIATSALRDPGIDFSTSDPYTHAMRDLPFISKVMLNNNRVPFVTLSVPIVKLGKPIGFIRGDLSLKKLWMWIDDISAASETSLSVVKRENGLVIADDTKSLIGRTHPHYQPGVGNVTVRTERGSMYVSMHEVPNMDLTIVTSSKIKAFSSALFDARYQLMIAALGLLLFSGVLSVYFAMRATRPLEALLSAMQKHVDKGEPAPESFPGEYGQIAQTFNRVLVELEEKQKALVQQQSLVAVGRVASGLAHELRHGLHLILNMVYFLKAGDEEKEMLRKTIQDMTGAIDGIMDFVRGDKMRMDPVESLHVTRQAIDSLTLSGFDRNARVINETKDDNLVFTGDQARLTSAVSNMLRNSLEAGALNTRLWIERDGKVVRFRVADDGAGFDQEVLERGFEPFYTTKKTGFGIGLSIVHSVAEAHGGEARIEAGAPGDTVVIMEIPYRESSDPEELLWRRRLAKNKQATQGKAGTAAEGQVDGREEVDGRESPVAKTVKEG